MANLNPSGAVNGNSQNVPEAHVPRTVSTFPLKYHFFNTHRFGEYTPHYVEDGVKNDRLPIRSSHEVRSYTLESPLMQNISRSKDYFMVPMEAILPLNWEKFFDNPVRGDDVLDDVGPSVATFWSLVASFNRSLFTGLRNALADSSSTTAVKFQALVRCFVIHEYFYSNGSLLASLGCHGAPYCFVEDTDLERYSFDYLFDQVFSLVSRYIEQEGMIINFVVDGFNYVVKSSSKSGVNGVISLRHALSLWRDNPTFVINSLPDEGDFVSDLLALFNQYSISYVNSSVPCDLRRVWAYQLVCAHFYSNDHIDFVYSAELFRQLIGSYIIRNSSSVSGSRIFNRNGFSYYYDNLSAHFFTLILTYLSSSAASSGLLVSSSNQVYDVNLGYLSALFGYRRSLRYLDYFTGSRSQPLAVAGTGMSSTNVPVVQNQVSVIDVTRSIQAQRFLNAVNRVRHSFEGYLKGVFGGSVPAPDFHNPFFIAHTDDTIFGQETENTGSAQFEKGIAITTNLRSNGARFMIECSLDRPAVVIGITHYDLPRVYSTTIERNFFHVNRFDDFNPFMQFVGDQQIYQQELGLVATGGLTNFAYTLRHMEYKQRYNQCAGGFVENLPGWIFLTPVRRGSQYTINPDWIRSVNSEFDNFFVSLSGWSNGSYYHFIVDDYNDVSGQRPMAYAPSIL